MRDPERVQDGPTHDAAWWGQFAEVSDRFDAAVLVEGLGELIEPRVTAPLLRREVQLATEWVVKHLNRPKSAELTANAEAAVKRLAETLHRIDDRSGGGVSTAEAAALCLALQGRLAEAAEAAERFLGTAPLLRLFVTALRMEYFDIPLATRLLESGKSPQQAVGAAMLVGRYSWWPAWLLRVVTQRALAGTLD